MLCQAAPPAARWPTARRTRALAWPRRRLGPLPWAELGHTAKEPPYAVGRIGAHGKGALFAVGRIGWHTAKGATPT